VAEKLELEADGLHSLNHPERRFSDVHYTPCRERSYVTPTAILIAMNIIVV
jgi:hypothetical protein